MLPARAITAVVIYLDYGILFMQTLIIYFHTEHACQEHKHQGPRN